MKGRNFSVKVRESTVQLYGKSLRRTAIYCDVQARELTVPLRSVTAKARNCLRRQGISL